MFRRKFIFSQRLFSSSWWEMSWITFSRINHSFLFRRKISASIDKLTPLRNIYLVSLFFLNFLASFFLSCTRPFLSSTSLILSLSFSLPLFLSHSAHIQLVEKLRQLLHVIFSRRSVSSLPIVFSFFSFFSPDLLKILLSLEFFETRSIRLILASFSQSISLNNPPNNAYRTATKVWASPSRSENWTIWILLASSFFWFFEIDFVDSRRLSDRHAGC